jgi:protein TonB
VQTERYISSYISPGRQSLKQIAFPALISLVLHGAILTVLVLTPTTSGPSITQVIEVTLESAKQNTPLAPVRKNTTPSEIQPKPVTIPITSPIVEPTPAVSPPAPTSPKVESTAATTTTPNPTAASEDIQPLFRLTRMPSFSRKEEASYPITERRAGIQATVLAEVTINAQGNILEVRILKSGGSAFDEAVKQSLQQSQFNPGIIDGKPVGTRFQVPFRFKLN